VWALLKLLVLYRSSQMWPECSWCHPAVVDLHTRWFSVTSRRFAAVLVSHFSAPSFSARTSAPCSVPCPTTGRLSTSLLSTRRVRCWRWMRTSFSQDFRLRSPSRTAFHPPTTSSRYWAVLWPDRSCWSQKGRRLDRCYGKSTRWHPRSVMSNFCGTLWRV